MLSMALTSTTGCTDPLGQKPGPGRAGQRQIPLLAAAHWGYSPQAPGGAPRVAEGSLTTSPGPAALRALQGLLVFRFAHSHCAPSARRCAACCEPTKPKPINPQRPRRDEHHHRAPYRLRLAIDAPTRPDTRGISQRPRCPQAPLLVEHRKFLRARVDGTCQTLCLDAYSVSQLTNEPGARRLHGGARVAKSTFRDAAHLSAERPAQSGLCLPCALANGVYWSEIGEGWRMK